MKRLDLIISEKELDPVLEALDKSSVPGYSVIKHVTGRGEYASISDGMDFTGLGANAHIIVFCDQEILVNLSELVKPILDYYGGVAYVSDANKL